MNIQQPQERITKKILVTVRDFRGNVRWMLATGTKVGNFYHVDQSVITRLANGIPNGATFTCG